MRNIISLIIAVALSGCIFIPEYEEVHYTDADIKAVLVGVENGFAGKCTGSLKDIDIMKKIVRRCGITNVTSLVDAQATFKNVKAEMQKASESELMIFYYSGHGGSLPNTNLVAEVDGYDECLCLYDTIMKDDQIWEIISKSKNRVFLIIDSCHSETMFRSPVFSMKHIPMMTSSNAGSFSMTCWSGCPDDDSSYGSKDGGYFTRTIEKYFKPDRTYIQVWNMVKSDRSLKNNQTCVCTEIGESFSGSLILR